MKKQMKLNEKNSAKNIEKEHRQTFNKFKRQVRRNNTNSFSCNNYCFIDFGGCGNKFNNRTKWNIC